MFSPSIFITLALALPIPTLAELTELTQEGGRGFCAAEPPLEVLDNIAQMAVAEDEGRTAMTSSDRASVGRAVAPLTAIEIDTWVHVVAASTAPQDGYLSDTAIYNQIKVLNDTYGPQNINFKLKGFDRTINASWAADTIGTELPMKKALRKGTYKTLNLYYLKTMRGNSLGFCSFPNRVTLNSNAYYLDGCSQRFDTTPGGSLRNFNQGKTTTHEVGHWFGLIHTFQGNNCTGSGDLIADTPAQASSTFGCPVGRDSCPNQPGVDPIRNYMDYSFDGCYTNFTPGQKIRMYDMYQQYRQNAP